MMPKKPEKEKRSYMIGVKIDPTTKEKIEYLAGMEAETVSTYIYNIIKDHIAKKEPWVSDDIKRIKEGGQ